MNESRQKKDVESVFWENFSDFKKIAWPAWLIPDLLPQRSMALLYGWRGRGKTFLALDIAASIATGKPWLGREITKSGRVAYLLAERPEGLKRRLRGWLQHSKGDAALLAQHFIAGKGTLPLDTPEGEEAICEELQGQGLELLVIDPLASFIKGSENETQAMSAFVKAVDRIVNRLSCTVLLVHHEGKGNYQNRKGARGSSALEAAMDTVIYLDSVDEESDVFELKITKQREFRAASDLFLRLEPQKLPATDVDADGEERDLGKFPRAVEKPAERVAAEKRALEDAVQLDRRNSLLRVIIERSKNDEGVTIRSLVNTEGVTGKYNLVSGDLDFLAECGRLKMGKKGKAKTFTVFNPAAVTLEEIEERI